MRIPRLLCALALLALAMPARAQGPTAENMVPNQMERGVSLSSPSHHPSSHSPSPSHASPPDVTKQLQTELTRVGCFAGAIDGIWGDMTRAALADFGRRAKLAVATDGPTSGVLEAVQSRRDRVCPLDCGPARIEQNGQCVAKAVPAPAPQVKPAVRPQPTVETRRAPRAKPDDGGGNSGMCWRNDGRSTALVPCSEAPTGRRAY